jgi:GTP1/Obg family GTP-binding protein
MIFEQSLTIFQSIIVMAFSAFLVFIWRFYVFRKNSLNALTQLPSIIVVGNKLSGKTSLVRAITSNEPLKHPLEDDLGINYLKEGDKKVQVIDANVTTEDLERLKRFNLKSFIYVFDASSDPESFKNQIKDFEKFKEIFSGVKSFVVLNKIDLVEKREIKKIKDNFQNVYEISTKTNKGLENLKKSVLTSLGV